MFFRLSVTSNSGSSVEDFAAAPAALKDYVTYLEAQLNVPIRVISVGPDRKQTLQN